MNELHRIEVCCSKVRDRAVTGPQPQLAVRAAVAGCRVKFRLQARDELSGRSAVGVRGENRKPGSTHMSDNVGLSGLGSKEARDFRKLAFGSARNHLPGCSESRFLGRYSNAREGLVLSRCPRPELLGDLVEAKGRVETAGGVHQALRLREL